MSDGIWAFLERIVIVLCLGVIVVEALHIVGLRQQVEELQRDNIILRAFLRENKANKDNG